MSDKLIEQEDLEPLLVTVRTSCRVTGLGATKIYEMIAAGAIESVKVDGRRLIKYSSLKKIAAGGYAGPASSAA